MLLKSQDHTVHSNCSYFIYFRASGVSEVFESTYTPKTYTPSMTRSSGRDELTVPSSRMVKPRKDEVEDSETWAPISSKSADVLY